MRSNIREFDSPGRLRMALQQEEDVDFIRAKFNVSAKDAKKAIQYAGHSREKIVEYLRRIFSGKRG
jgi:hypothetical protein